MTHHEVSRYNNWRWRVTFKKAKKVPYIFAAEFPPPSFQTSGLCLAAASAKSNQQEHFSSQIKCPFTHHVILFLKPPRVRINWFPLKRIFCCWERCSSVFHFWLKECVKPNSCWFKWRPEVRHKNLLFLELSLAHCFELFPWNVIFFLHRNIIVKLTSVCTWPCSRGNAVTRGIFKKSIF